MDEERIKTEDWGSADVKCPFWKGTSQRGIFCEGLRRGETIRRLLPNKHAKAREMKKFCCADYELCGIFQLVYGGYQ